MSREVSDGWSMTELVRPGTRGGKSRPRPDGGVADELGEGSPKLVLTPPFTGAAWVPCCSFGSGTLSTEQEREARSSLGGDLREGAGAAAAGLSLDGGAACMLPPGAGGSCCCPGRGAVDPMTRFWDRGCITVKRQRAYEGEETKGYLVHWKGLQKWQSTLEPRRNLNAECLREFSNPSEPDQSRLDAATERLVYELQKKLSNPRRSNGRRPDITSRRRVTPALECRAEEATTKGPLSAWETTLAEVVPISPLGGFVARKGLGRNNRKWRPKMIRAEYTLTEVPQLAHRHPESSHSNTPRFLRRVTPFRASVIPARTWETTLAEVVPISPLGGFVARKGLGRNNRKWRPKIIRAEYILTEVPQLAHRHPESSHSNPPRFLRRVTPFRASVIPARSKGPAQLRA
ncbi:hypothetical protein ISCGN_020635 [Ixodes scapularis]